MGLLMLHVDFEVRVVQVVEEEHVRELAMYSHVLVSDASHLQAGKTTTKKYIIIIIVPCSGLLLEHVVSLVYMGCC